MRSEWIDCTLGDVLELQRGFDLPVQDRHPGSVPVVASTGVVGFHDATQVKGPGVVIGRSGSIGGGQYLPQDFWPLNTTLWVKDFKGNLPRYCYYLLRSIDFTKFNAGSGVPTLNRNHVHPLSVRLAPKSEQLAIAVLLGGLDERINLLHQTNATLESIAKALFKSWFIDFDPVRAKAEGREPEGMDAATSALFPAEFEDSALGLIPKGWSVCRLSDLLELSYGKALKATDRRDGQVPVYGSGGITGHHDEALVQSGAIIVGRKGTVGSLYWEDRPFFPIDTTFYVKPKTAPMTFCFYALQRLGLESMNTDAAVPGLNRENAYRLELTTAPSPVLVAFDELTSTLRSIMRCNDERAALIASLRDSLLPRLISGKLRLPDAKEQVEDVLA